MSRTLNSALSGQRITVRTDDDLLLEGQAFAATDNTAAIAPKGATRVGLYLNQTTAGTSPTLDIAFEQSMDKGTTWVGLPATANSQTAAAMAQITTSGKAYEYYEVNCDPEYSRVRAVLTTGGTSPVFTIVQAYWVLSGIE